MLRALWNETTAEHGVDLGPALGPDDDAVEAERCRLLGSAGSVSAYASDYVRDGYADKGPILGDIAGFYRAFGFEAKLAEAPDHFANLLSFLALLAVKQAYAEYHGNAEEAEVAKDAESKLLAEHLHPYLGRFAARLAVCAPEEGVYAAVAAGLTEAAAKWEAENPAAAIAGEAGLNHGCGDCGLTAEDA